MNSDAEVLFPEREIHGLVVRPWSFGQLMQIMPAIEPVLADAKAMGVDPTKFDSEAAVADQLMGVVRLVLRAPASVQQVLAVTLGADQLEKLNAMRADMGVDVVLAVFAQNKEHFADFFRRLMVRAEEAPSQAS